jgi:heme-degrading monooxygenase HmoA
MFARHVSMHLKSNSAAEFTRILETQVIPLLRRQRGFRDEITFVTPGSDEVIGISLWDNKENAEAYNRGSFPEVLKSLSKVIEGTPQIRNLEVSNSTFHNIAARAVGS